MSKFAKLLLVSTSFAPIIITYAFVLWLSNRSLVYISALLALTLSLVVLCLLLLRQAKHHLERQTITISAITPSDNQVIGFVIAYLLPILSLTDPHIDLPVLAFMAIVFILLIWSTNAYHINPLLSFFGYHFYQVSLNDKVTYLLLTRKELHRTATIQTVIHLTDYMLLDGEVEND